MIRAKIQLLFRRVVNANNLTWITLAIVFSYLLFFVYPIFFSEVMNYPKYVPALKPIGIDLKNTIRITNIFFVDKQSPYYGGNSYAYPPFTSILFFPLLLVNMSFAYKIITIINVICYIVITYFFPLWTEKKKQITPLIMLIFITGLFSYGFQFELERGQFNLIAVVMSFLAIWIFHYRNKYRPLAYALFIISVQLKIYPFIFIVMLINNWRDWKNNTKRFLLLTAANIVALFILGPKIFTDFVDAIINHTNSPYIWLGNHSIHSFVTQITEIISRHGWTWIAQYTKLTEFVLLTIVAGCIFIIILRSYRQRQIGLNPFLLLACTIGALLIPSASHDYTLSILPAPVAIFLSSNISRMKTNSIRLRILFTVLLIIFSFAYSTTLFSYTNKFYYIFENNFPALFIMLLVVTFLSLASKPTHNRKRSINTALSRRWDQ